MGHRCLFKGCKSSSVLHGFPHDAARVRLWLRAGGRLVGHQLPTRRNCSCVASIFFLGRAGRIGERWSSGLAHESSLRLDNDVVPSPEDFSVLSKGLCV